MANDGEGSDAAAGVVAYVGLGANLGERRTAIERAVALLDETREVRVEAVSALHETEPVGGPAGQPAYLNGAARLRTTLEPHALLDRLLAVEHALARTREVRWGPRTLDLDLLLYADRVVESERLIVPHPRLRERAFVLQPLAEIGACALIPATAGQPAQTVAAAWRALAASGSGAPPGRA